MLQSLWPVLYSSSNKAKSCHEKYIFVQCSFSETAKEVLKRTVNKASGNDFRWVCRCKSKSDCEDFKCSVSTENLHYVFDIGDHPTEVKCLPIAAESFRWMSSFKWKSGSVFQMDGRKAKLSKFIFADLDDAVEQWTSTLAVGLEAESFAKQNTW